jgi:cell division protein FtsZ
VIFGAVVDENMKDQIRITVVATGFDQQSAMPRRVIRQGSTTTTTSRSSSSSRYPQPSTPASQPAREPEEVTRPAALDPDNLELPSFLRRR